ncbi:uncharacterized protein LOC115744613 isoform X1 [Rhodamnia argentea]|uniref:Uncharacterized protein LOC115744613 isoform X1 n=1 Tax=Rhodamnia argentea TaxID=178133 RepID=A0A8B8PNE5_9MYRT|nr:uncharacterized protein LOC115744613 isoform X1 [Rhodamnia argentea]
MVQLMKSGDFGADRGAASCGGDKLPVKLEIVEDPLEEEHGPLNKRSRGSSSLEQLWGAGANAFPVPPSQYNPLDEPSPLGLRLRKSPSLLDLIQMKLSQGTCNLATTQSDNLVHETNKDAKSNASFGTTDKMKASNFPASFLRIGQWEYKSRYEGDLVAKCYFAKHKLVWEVLEGGLKSKIEIQWSDIMALKANCPDDGLSTLKVVLARQPLFYRETNPQPRKHTLWQATSDFTDGQASTHRQHFLQFQPGLLYKHFEKLIQCDMRLNFLSRQPEVVLESPLFDTRPSIFEDLEEPKGCGFDNGTKDDKSGISSLHVSQAAQSSSVKTEIQERVGTTSERMSREAPSPSSVMDARVIEGNGNRDAVEMKASRNWDQIKVPGLHPSMSMSDLMNHIGYCITEQMGSGSSSDDGSGCQEILEDIAQYLLSDTQSTTASDEKCLMARVNSLCCLLQKDSTTVQNLAGGESCEEKTKDVKDAAPPGVNSNTLANVKALEDDSKPAGMSRKDSFGELLLHLPRIASLPKFLFNISEEDSDSTSR